MRPTNVEDVMTRIVVSVAEDVPFKDLVRMMHENRVGGVPIVDATNRLVGIVTEADLLRAEGGTREDARHSLLEWIAHPARLARIEERAGDLRARDLMTKDVVTLTPDTHVHDAIRTLLEAGVRRLPVVDMGGKVIGIVTRRNLLQPFLRSDEDIHRDVTDDVIRRTMWIDPATLEVQVEGGSSPSKGEWTAGARRRSCRLWRGGWTGSWA